MFGKPDKHAIISKGVNQHLPRLWRYCLMLTAGAETAADLTQATCVRALEKADLYKTDTPLDRWLFRIAKNIWFNEVRANAIRQGNGVYSVDELEIVSAQAGPEVNLINQDIIHSVLSLPEAQRITVALVYIEGYSYKQAAELLDIPVGTIMSRLASAREKLSNKLLHFKERQL